MKKTLLTIFIGTLFSSATIAQTQQLSLLQAQNSKNFKEYSSTYGKHPLQTVDLHLPYSDGLNRGLVVWIHGGGWTGGDKSEDKHLFLSLLSSGFAVVNVNYRLGPDGAFPNSVHDVESVLEAIDKGGCSNCSDPKLWKKAKEYIKNGVFINGASAGGYLSVWGGASYLLNRNPSFNLKCIGNIVGPVDLRNVSDYPGFSQGLLAAYSQNNLSAGKLNEMSPAFWAENGTLRPLNNKVKWFLDYSSIDDIVPFKTTQSFTTGLVKNGAKVVQYVHPGVRDGGHNIATNTVKGQLFQETKQCFGFAGLSYERIPWYLEPNRAKTYNYGVGQYPLANKGSFSIDKNGNISGKHIAQYCVFQNKTYTYNGKGQCLYSDGQWYPQNTPGVSVDTTTFTLQGIMDSKGYIDASWTEDSSGIKGKWNGKGHQNGNLIMNIILADKSVISTYPR